MNRSIHLPAPWELSEGDTSIWAVSPLGARVRIANVIKHCSANGINHHANAHLMKASPNLLNAAKQMLAAWEEQFGEDACDCQPEPQNSGHICQCCIARNAIREATSPA